MTTKDITKKEGIARKAMKALVGMVNNVGVKYILVHRKSGEIATQKPLSREDIKIRILALDDPQEYVIAPLAQPMHIRKRANVVLVGHIPGVKIANY